MLPLRPPVHHLRKCGEPADPCGQAQWVPAEFRQKQDREQHDQTIQNSLEREVTTERLGEMVMERLKPVDEVAYIRFASIYHQFQDAGSFMREISKYLEEK